MGVKYKNRIRELREESGKSGVEIASLLGISPQYYYALETGRDNKRLNEEILIKLADIFNVSIDYMLGLTDIRRSKDIKVSESSPNYTEIIAPFPTGGNPMKELPPEALKELESYADYLYNKWKGWKKGDPPR